MVFRRLIVLLTVTMFLVVFTAMKKLPGESGADKKLQKGASQIVMMLESFKDKPCKKSKIVNTEITEHPKNPGKDPWTELWTVDRCGILVYYKVGFTPSPKGGTDFVVSPLE